MRYALVLLLACGLAAALQEPGRREGGPRLEIVEIAAARSENRLTVDGRLKNAWNRPLTKIVLVVELLDSDRKLIGQRRGTIEPELLEPGEEAAFHFYLPLQPRSVQVRLAAEAARVPYVEVLKPGPYPIE
ncbi:MAG: FxLYD domain-containing protein [Bryobacteraceae bacterium]